MLWSLAREIQEVAEALEFGPCLSVPDLVSKLTGWYEDLDGDRGLGGGKDCWHCELSIEVEELREQLVDAVDDFSVRRDEFEDGAGI